MTDSTHMAPTDDELDELRQANSGRLNFVTFREFRVIARAVLAKWGTQQPVECEPLIRQMRNALALPCDRWNATQARIVREAIDAADAWLEGN